MLFGDDVFDVKRQEIGVVPVQTAVFTAIAGPVSNERSKGGIHQSPGESARSCRALDLRMAMKVP
jgi:hypothetical protein